MDENRTGPRHRSSVEAFENSNAIVGLLARHRLVVAPHVASRLGLALCGDADAIIEVATLLRTSQRLGLSVLPDPLPLVPAITAAIGPHGERLTAWERQVLVIAAVCTDDRSDVLLAAGGRSMAELVDGQLSRHLLLVAGHFAFADPRMRIWVHAEASLADRTAAHERLADAYAGLGNDDQAVWHRSLATLEGSPDLVAPLLRIAKRADAAGDAERAHAVAREAESHATGERAALARRVAGRAALHGGFVEDAELWLGELLTEGDDGDRAHVLGDALLATTLLHGDVAESDLDDQLERLEQTDRTDAEQAAGRARALARAAALTAGLLAERGAMQRAVRRLDQAAALIDRHGLAADDWVVGHARYRLFAGVGLHGGASESADAPILPVSVAAAWAASGAAGGSGGADGADRDGLDVSSGSGEEPADGAQTGSLHAVAIALERGLAGDPSGAVRWLGARRTTVPSGPTADVGFERSPLVRAERAVAIALLELWAGEVSRAANGLRQAACDLPIALAFAGLGAALARRLELVATGEVGPWARAVEASLPPTSTCIRREDLVDRAVEAHLHGRRAEAETLVALADERARGGFGCGLHIPGLDAAAELTSTRAHDDGAGIARRPPDARLASELRHGMRGIGRAGFAAEYSAIADRARSIRSPYERARTELMLARVCAASGDVDAAGRHLVAAEHLFAGCGATGWLRAVAAERVAQIATRRAAATSIATVDVAGVARGGPRPVERSAAPDGGPEQVRPSAASDAPTADDMLDECRAVWAELLTERELEVAMLVVEGCSNREAASRLYVSVRTVEVHVGRVFTKLAVHSRVELAVLAHRMHGRLSASRR
ncbi:LuxR C-terminal-related transcriptional regulator [Agromyces sp. NPDC058110]|uniref:helix-turn-helix transcriptional regulator n=1 Tax=Agromyces sp. NPDC058110 TaxID=3346345 RepID=UPI0036D877B8